MLEYVFAREKAQVSRWPRHAGGRISNFWNSGTTNVLVPTIQTKCHQNRTRFIIDPYIQKWSLITGGRPSQGSLKIFLVCQSLYPNAKGNT